VSFIIKTYGTDDGSFYVAELVEEWLP
jgi:hypothetical protein